MKQITKTQEPRSLVQHRAQRGTFENLQKDELRESLLNEQGYICCYCMNRIPHKLKREQIEKNYPSNKIEHVKCQSQNANLELNYQNMLLACNGNHGSPKIMQSCDTYKGESDLSFNPANKERNIENFIKYKSNGEIYSDDATIDTELNKVLNLNTKDLKGIREIFYKNIQEKIIREGKNRVGKDIQKRFYESEKQNLVTMLNRKFTPFCMIGIYLINKRLRRYN